MFHCPSPLRLIAPALLLTLASTALAERDPIRLTHGPMLGKPTAHSMSVWGQIGRAHV